MYSLCTIFASTCTIICTSSLLKYMFRYRNRRSEEAKSNTVQDSSGKKVRVKKNHIAVIQRYNLNLH